jgi:hypothetical protein
MAVISRPFRFLFRLARQSAESIGVAAVAETMTMAIA